MKSNIQFLYEELREATDGGSESMTHDDAVRQVMYWRRKEWMHAPLPINAIMQEFDRKVWTHTEFADGARGILLDSIAVIDFVRAIEKRLGYVK